MPFSHLNVCHFIQVGKPQCIGTVRAQTQMLINQSKVGKILPKLQTHKEHLIMIYLPLGPVHANILDLTLRLPD